MLLFDLYVRELDDIKINLAGKLHRFHYFLSMLSKTTNTTEHRQNLKCHVFTHVLDNLNKSNSLQEKRVETNLKIKKEKTWKMKLKSKMMI